MGKPHSRANVKRVIAATKKQGDKQKAATAAKTKTPAKGPTYGGKEMPREAQPLNAFDGSYNANGTIPDGGVPYVPVAD